MVLPFLFCDSPRSLELSKKYGYPTWMTSRFIEIIPDTQKLLDALASKPRRYIRINTLKTKVKDLVERLLAIGFDIKQTILPEVFEITREKFSLGSTIEYLLGYYYIQDLSSCLAVEELDVSAEQRVLDMACAPGGKTTYLAQKMNNNGVLIALDPNRKRIRSTFFNLMRCGVRNTLVYQMDATNVFRLGIKYDRILLDAPCSCEGVISKDRSLLDNHYPGLINKCAERQRALIRAAIKVTKPGGLIVYSTCTFAPEENEIALNSILDSYDNIEIEPVAIGENGLTTFGRFTLNSSLKDTKRLYPHIHGTLGFYIAKLRVKNVSL